MGIYSNAEETNNIPMLINGADPFFIIPPPCLFGKKNISPIIRE
jgi:hypothetical protein